MARQAGRGARPRGSTRGRSLYVAMPGAAATTAGIALIGGIAVMMWPSTMKSAIVSASKSGGGRKPTFSVTVGQSVDLDHPTVLVDLPVGFERLALAPADVELDDDLVTDESLPARGDTGDASRRDGPRPEVEVGRGLRVLGVAAHLVELDPSASATSRTASPKTAVPCAVIAWRSGWSIGWPKPTGVSVAGES